MKKLSKITMVMFGVLTVSLAARVSYGFPGTTIFVDATPFMSSMSQVNQLGDLYLSLISTGGPLNNGFSPISPMTCTFPIHMQSGMPSYRTTLNGVMTATGSPQGCGFQQNDPITQWALSPLECDPYSKNPPSFCDSSSYAGQIYYVYQMSWSGSFVMPPSSPGLPSYAYPIVQTDPKSCTLYTPDLNAVNTTISIAFDPKHLWGVVTCSLGPN